MRLWEAISHPHSHKAPWSWSVYGRQLPAEFPHSSETAAPLPPKQRTQPHPIFTWRRHTRGEGTTKPLFVLWTNSLCPRSLGVYMLCVLLEIIPRFPHNSLCPCCSLAAVRTNHSIPQTHVGSLAASEREAAERERNGQSPIFKGFSACVQRRMQPCSTWAFYIGLWADFCLNTDNTCEAIGPCGLAR